MKNCQALNILARYATDKIETRPAREKTEIYYALSEVLPDHDSRMGAQRLAFAIQETDKLQIDFLSALLAAGAEANTK
jgi:hypothetical protein